MSRTGLETTTKGLVADAKTIVEKAEAIFYFVRDEIKFDVYVGDFFRTADDT